MSVADRSPDCSPRRTTEETRLLTVQDVARTLSISPATVHRLAARGWLRKLHIGSSTRFAHDDVLDLIERAAERDWGKP